ncbi:MAG: HAMP domain-containing protein [Nocardiopsaceae bacterium]|nr:HAMP domain-containing protein [Nocardiopsaceae bacterium]
MSQRGSVIGQLLTASCVVAILLVIAVAAGYVAVDRQGVPARQMLDRVNLLQPAAGQLRESFSASQAAVSAAVLSGRSGVLRPVAANRASFAGNAAVVRRLAPGPLRGLARAQTAAGERLFTIADEIRRLGPGTAVARRLASGVQGIAAAFSRANHAFQRDLAARRQHLTSERESALGAGLAWSAAAVGIAVLLVLAASLGTLHRINRPLRNLTATVRRLTAGDHSARAEVGGSAEVREVARAVNAQADEADRLRAQERQSSQLRAMARQAGLRIREHLAEAEVLDEARAALEQIVDADAVYLRVLADGQSAEVIGREPGYAARAGIMRHPLAPERLAEMTALFRAQGSHVIQDAQSEEGKWIPADMRDAVRAAGVTAQLLTPFGAGSELLGLIVAQRLQGGRPWLRAEVDAVESIAADLGRGLNQARLYEAENRLVDELTAVDRAKSDFFATVSHEMRAPLTSVEGYLEMLRQGEAGPVTSVQAKMLEVIDRNAGRLRNLIEDVFTLSKLESRAFSSVTRPVNMAGVVTGAVDAVRPSAAAGGLALGVAVADRPLLVEGDAGQLDRALINLLSNAVKFTPAGGRVTVSAASEASAAVIRVADTGIGIPEADQKELFGRFFRASNARERTQGAGLGLAIVQTIVANHHGEVSLDSREGGGTTVTVMLPLVAEAIS